MNRHPQWEARLQALVLKHRDRPYEWGRWDCLMLAAEAAKAITGKDHAKGHRGKYDSHASAYRHLRQHFGADSPETLLDNLFEEKPVGFAQRGDLVLCDFSDVEDASTPGPVPGVCMGAFALCLVAEHPETGSFDGLVRVWRERWVKAWAVGDHHSSLLS